MNKSRFAILCGLFLASHQAFAQLQLEPEEERPLHLQVSGSVTHDSNLFRLPSEVDAQAAIGSSDKSDNIFRIGAGGKYEAQVSRQKFLVEANVDDYRFQNFDNLNNDSYDGRGEWKWQAGNFWDGTLGIGQRRSLAGFANLQQNIKDMIDQGRAYGSANYNLHSHLRFTLDLSWYDNRHSADSQKIFDSRVDNTAFTVNWVTPAQNTVGLQYRTTNAHYPNRDPVTTAGLDNAYRENEYNLVAHWRASGASDFVFRLGHTERTFDQSPTRNFSGPTWRITYNWQPVGKVGLELATWREIAEFETLGTNYVRSTGFSLAPTWAITPKTSLRAKASYVTDKFLGDSGIVVVTNSREDKGRIYQLSAIWSPVRQTNVTLALETGERTSNQQFVDYKYQSVLLSAMRIF